MCDENVSPPFENENRGESLFFQYQQKWWGLEATLVKMAAGQSWPVSCLYFTGCYFEQDWRIHLYNVNYTNFNSCWLKVLINSQPTWNSLYVWFACNWNTTSLIPSFSSESTHQTLLYCTLKFDQCLCQLRVNRRMVTLKRSNGSLQPSFGKNTFVLIIRIILLLEIKF